MLDVFDGDFIGSDLSALPQSQADLIEAFLDEIIASQQALNTLLRRNDSYAHPAFNVRGIDCFINRGFNVSRIRPLTPRLANFRILFALDNSTDDFYLLAIVRKCRNDELATTGKCYDYHPNHPISNRVCQDYDKLKLPVLNS